VTALGWALVAWILISSLAADAVVGVCWAAAARGSRTAQRTLPNLARTALALTAWNTVTMAVWLI